MHRHAIGRRRAKGRRHRHAIGRRRAKRRRHRHAKGRWRHAKGRWRHAKGRWRHAKGRWRHAKRRRHAERRCRHAKAVAKVLSQVCAIVSRVATHRTAAANPQRGDHAVGVETVPAATHRHRRLRSHVVVANGADLTDLHVVTYAHTQLHLKGTLKQEKTLDESLFISVGNAIRTRNGLIYLGQCRVRRGQSFGFRDYGFAVDSCPALPQTPKLGEGRGQGDAFVPAWVMHVLKNAINCCSLTLRELTRSTECRAVLHRRLTDAILEDNHTARHHLS